MIQKNKPGNENASQPPRLSVVVVRAGALICVILVLIMWLSDRHQLQNRGNRGLSSDDANVPAYSRTAPTGPLPATIPAGQFDDPDARQAYAAAAKVKTVLAQLPCYCYCDRTNRHKNLLDCFRSYHAAGCLVCQREAKYAYQQFRNGKTIAEIRQAIIHGDWKALSK